jgi:hypothetical protein
MNEIPSILSIFGDKSVRDIWEPLLSPYSGCTVLVKEAEITGACCRPAALGFVPQLAIVSSDLYPDRGTRIMEILRAEYPGLDIVVLALADARHIPLSILIKDRVCHFAVADPADDSERVRELFRALTTNEPWQFSSYLRPDADLHEFSLFSPREKEPIIGRIEKLVEGSSADLDLLRQKAGLLADEMIENALQAASGEMLSKQGILIKAGFDGETLALQVIDYWGTLTPAKALEHLARHQDGKICVDLPRGRGLFILWQFFDHFHVNVTLGERTAVGGKLNRKSVLDRDRMKGFDFFQCSASSRSHASNL